MLGPCKTCCIDMSFAARIVGTYTMSISILMINVLVSNFFARMEDEDFFESVTSWAIFGLNWMQAFRYTHLQKKAQTAMVCFLIYIILFLLASMYLAMGSISRRHKYAVPWMYLQIINIIDQTVALCDQIIYDENVTLATSVTCSSYLILSVYLWMIVHAARNQWYEVQQNHVECESTMSDFLPELPTDGSGLKSPSFLSQNFSMFESPRPPTILPK
ncbi:uncharacterized protein [Anoplolepis gracilipes]|uniref:uncharacterized protein n=1 Tax=Anoplolepis gracilipes TaxID=354296 RepID=UPI003B9F4209